MTHEKFFETFRQRAEDGLRLWESPSVAVGVVKDGKVVLCEGYGLRDKAGKLPATGETLYQIGSCSKAFTATAAALLATDGALDLDAPVREYVMKWEQTQGFIRRWIDLIDYMVPLYCAEGKSQLVIAVGCTGGHHRSVALAQHLCDHFLVQGKRASVTHRDIKKG